jgi:hypothetical protein
MELSRQHYRNWGFRVKLMNDYAVRRSVNRMTNATAHNARINYGLDERDRRVHGLVRG